MPLIDVPGMGVVEFPDDMTDDQIVAAIRANSQPEPVIERPKGPQSRPVLARQHEMGKGEAALFGAKKFVQDTGMGLSQLMTTYAGLKGAGRADEVAAQKRKEVETARIKDAALMRQPGASVGYMGAAMVPAVGSMFLPGANTLLGAGLIGGAMGAAQPTAQEGERAWNTMLGAGASVAGQGAANLLGRVAQPVRKALSAEEEAAVELLKREGVPLTVGQQTGSRAVQGAERFLADNPVTAPSMVRAGERQGRAFTTAAMRTAGETADNAGPTVMGAAKTRIVGVLDDIESRYAADVNQILPDLTDLSDIATRNEAGPIIKQIDRIIRSTDPNGKLPGDLVAKIRTEIAPLRNHPVMGGLASDLEEILRNGLQQSMQGTDDFARYATARNQYRNLMSIADTVDTTARAQVSPAKLASRQNSSKYTKKSFRFGTGDQDLAGLARAGSTVVDRFPNSGTTARAAMQVLPAGAGALYGAFREDGSLEDAAKFAALGYFGPKAAAGLFTNPWAANYLAQGLSGPMRGLLTAPSYMPIGPMAAAGLLTAQ